ncbi:hypothetical protein LCGC14_0320470 [marine sediment metagenome]|uniref:Type II secretion system protein GspE N-terminal domain-containing protein n=1 Tax=marine sediment metagenome TaxID=412755 RepID=A0A0F9TQ37_9ZZZZ
MNDDNTLGELLVRMGKVERCDLDKMISFQKEAPADLLIGKMMVSENIITDTDLQVALRVQSGLRSGSRRLEALAISELAEQSHRKTQRTIFDVGDAARKLSRRVRHRPAPV